MTVVCAIHRPRSAIISTRSRKLSLKRKYHLTRNTMISRSKWRPSKSSSKPGNPAITPPSTHQTAGKIGRPTNCTRAVERTIVWLNRCRRLAKDWDNLNHDALTSSASPPSASCSENSVIPHEVSGRTLSEHQHGERLRVEQPRRRIAGDQPIQRGGSGTVGLWVALVRPRRARSPCGWKSDPGNGRLAR